MTITAPIKTSIATSQGGNTRFIAIGLRSFLSAWKLYKLYHAFISGCSLMILRIPSLV